MVAVELDIFSGRPNPRWTLSPKEAQQLAERVRADPSQLLPLDSEAGGLGYRGFVITAQDTGEADAWKRAGLPSRVRLGGQFRPESLGSSRFLLHTAESARLDLKDPGQVFGVAEKVMTATAKLAGGAGLACTSDTEFGFWNDPAHRPFNNCYNYASNLRTNSFAQPGRAAGAVWRGLDDASLVAAVTRDGWASSSVGDDAYNVCLVVWPGTDYHLYRLAANGTWCHKPGPAAVRNFDNSGKRILNPETSDRGPYTAFYGYYRGLGVSVS